MTATDLASDEPRADTDGADAADGMGTAAGTLRAAAVVGGLGAVLVLLAGSGIDAFAGAGAQAVATEVLLTAAGIVVAAMWRRPGGLRRLWTLAVPSVVVLALFSAVFTGLMATGPEVDSSQGAALSSMAGVTNWWLVFAPPLQLAPDPPLAGLWLGAILLQLVLLGLAGARLVARRRHGAAAPAEPIAGLPRGAALAAAGAVAGALWLALLTLLAQVSGPGSSPLGNPGNLPDALVRTLGIDAGNEPLRLLYGTDTRLSGFLLGVAVAVAAPALRGRRLPGAVLAAAGAVVAVGLTLAAPADLGWLGFGGLLLAGVAAACVAVGVQAPIGPPPVLSRALAWLGRRAWAVYLWVLPVAILTDADRAGLEGALQVLLRLVLPVLLGVVSVATVDRLVERRTRTVDGAPRPQRLLAVLEIALAATLLASVVAVRQPLWVYQQLDAEEHYTVLFAGDSMPYGLGSIVGGWNLDEPMGLTARLAALPGCGFTTGDLINGDVVSARLPGCDDLRSIMGEQIDEHDPAVVVLLAWAWELFDHRVTADDGTVTDYVVGTPAWRERFTREAQGIVDDLSADGAVVVLLTMPCVDPDADTPEHPTSVAATEPERLDEMNSMVRQLASWNPTTTVLVDLDGEYLCPDGDYRARIDDVLMSEDSVHFTEEGAEKVWVDYLAPRVWDVLGLGG